MIPMTENHIQQQQRKSELQLLLFSWSFGYFPLLFCRKYDMQTAKTAEEEKKRKKQAADIHSFPGHATSQKKRTPHLEESSAAILLPKTTDSLFLCLCLSLLMCVSLFSLSLFLSQSFAPKFATRTTPSRFWGGYLPHKQPHLEDSGLLQLSSLASKPALFVSLCPSVPLCVCSSVGFSVSLSLFRNFLCNFATALKIFLSVGLSLSIEFLCLGFLRNFLQLVEAI
jgi:hypothetical protein